MTGVATLLRHSLRRWRGFLATLVVGLAAFQIFMIAAARGLERSGRFAQLGALLPDFMQQWTNMAAASFRGFVLFGYSHPLVQLFLIAMAIAMGTEPAGEIESRFVDVLMARPVDRAAPIARTALLMALATAGAIASMLTATWIGLRVLAPESSRAPDARVVLSLAVNLACLVLAWGGVALALASAAKRRAVAAAAGGFLAFAGFVIDYVGRFWSAVEPASRVSPFHYFDPFGLIGGARLEWSNLAVLAGVFAGGAAIAAVVYAKRDL